jgi:pseudoazurin
MFVKAGFAALVFGFALAGSVSAAEFTVNMVNKDSEGRAMQFEPAFLKVAPGDVVHFVPVDKGHDSESVTIPEGAEKWKGKISQPVDVTFTAEGLYLYRCTPHVGLGMVGLIQVGENPANLEAVQETKLPGKAKTRLDELLQEQAAGGEAAPAAQ